MGFYNYGNVAKATTNEPGLMEIWVAPLSYLTTIQKPTASPSAAGDTQLISSAHVAADPGGFIKLLGTVKSKNSGKGSTAGDKGSKTQKWEIEVNVAGLNKEILEFIASGLNEDFILLAGNKCGSGEYLQFGTECKPAELMVESETGTQDSGFKGSKLKFTSIGVPCVYTAAVPEYSA
jgi:hypothetical protein